jgi:hypothetical protein
LRNRTQNLRRRKRIWGIFFSPKIYVENLISNVMVFGDEGPRKVTHSQRLIPHK